MKVIAYDNLKPGVTLDDLRPCLRDEVANVWRLWKAGIVILFECADLDEAKRHIAGFPLTKADLIEWQYIALDAPLPLEFLFDPTADVAEPWDRTPRA